MTSSGSQPESNRLSQLERRVRWMSSLLTFVTLGFVLLMMWTFVPRRHRIDAPSFVVRDSKGVSRAELGMWEDRPMIRLNNDAGKARAMMFVKDDGSATFRLSDKDGNHRLQLTLDETGIPSLVMANPEGRSMVAIQVEGDGRSTMALRDQDLKALWSAP